MPSAPDPRRSEPATEAGTGRHLLGPHVLGQRVVVRHLLRGETGPSGGPAMTDVLGVCTAWGERSARVRTADGEEVEIALADIVSGKPVPPRPSVRHRVPAQEAQTRALALWPDLALADLGAWKLRSSQTSTARRANSVLAMVPPGVPAAVEATIAHYRSVGTRPIAAVLPGAPEERLFLDAGWVPESGEFPTLFQIASVAHTRRLVPDRPAHAVNLEETGDHVVARCGAAASGTAAYSRDWVGLRGIEVDPAQRRRGLGLAILAALLGWGAERGASTAYLQVLADNHPALGLYDRLGFSTHHSYRYLAEPPDGHHDRHL